MKTFPKPVPKAIQEILKKIHGDKKEIDALHNLLVEKDSYGSFKFSAEYVTMSLNAEGYKISTSTVRTYRRMAVDNPFNKKASK